MKKPELTQEQAFKIIDEFFEKLTTEEYVKMAKRAGMPLKTSTEEVCNIGFNELGSLDLQGTYDISAKYSVKKQIKGQENISDVFVYQNAVFMVLTDIKTVCLGNVGESKYKVGDAIYFVSNIEVAKELFIIYQNII